MKRLTTLGAWAGAVAFAVISASCSDRADNKASEAARETGNAAERAGEATAGAARDAGNATAGAARDAGNATAGAARDAGGAVKDAGRGVGDAVGNAGRAGDAAVETMDVKLALTTDSRVDASNINVDTDHTTKTVTLKGRVPTAAQKTIAEQIATGKATGYRVINQLAVGS